MSALVAGQRYLVMTFGSAHIDGVFVKIDEMGPGLAYIEFAETLQIGNTGQIGKKANGGLPTGNVGAIRTRAWAECEELEGNVLVPWHNVDRIIPIGD